MSDAIIQDISAYEDFRTTKLCNESVKLIDAISESVKPYMRAQISKVSRCLECFLQVTGGPNLKCSLDWIQHRIFLKSFITALESPSFLKAKKTTRHAYIAAAKHLLKELCYCNGAHEVLVDNACMLPESTPFEQWTLEPTAVTLWRAWPVKKLAGNTIWLPLFGVYEAHGFDISTKLHAVCSDYVATRRLQKIPGLKELFEYIARKPKFRFEDFKTPETSRHFFKNFYDFYVEARSKTCKPQTVLADWSGGFRPFCQVALIGSGLFSHPVGGIPGPDSVDEEITKTDKGLEKLILPLSPALSTYEALSHLREEIPKAMRIVTHWATAHANDLYVRVKQRRNEARYGTARLLMQDRDGDVNSRLLVRRTNPHSYRNACATYERYGHLSRSDYENLHILFPEDLQRVASELGLPTRSALLPHATLLVMEHPQITPSYLETLQLWNSHGKLTGLIRQNNVTYLSGQKYRARAKHSRKRIALNRNSLRVIVQILRITANLRQYLKSRGDPNWRYLFLSCGKGFDHPMPIRFAPLTSGPERTAAIATQFQSVGAEMTKAQLLAANFTLRSVRATKAIGIFVATHSEVEMAKALGHARRSKVLNSYLPAAVAGFLRIRWMRAFQTRIVVHMTQNTPYAVLASGLRSAETLREFLANHPFPNIDLLGGASDERDSPDRPQESTQNATFVVNASTETLTLLANIVRTVDEATRPVNAEAKYWASLSRHIFDYATSQGGRQPSIARAVREATSNRYILDLGAAIYA